MVGPKDASAPARGSGPPAQAGRYEPARRRASANHQQQYCYTAQGARAESVKAGRRARQCETR
jgi:hypothetical protein